MNFLQLAISNSKYLKQINDFVDQWHNSNSELTLAQYLGFTEQEYSLWVRRPDLLPNIVKKRRPKTHLRKKFTDYFKVGSVVSLVRSEHGYYSDGEEGFIVKIEEDYCDVQLERPRKEIVRVFHVRDLIDEKRSKRIVGQST